MLEQRQPAGEAGHTPAMPAVPAELYRHLYAATLQPDFWVRILSLLAPLFGCEKAMAAGFDRNHPCSAMTEIIGFSPASAALLRNRDQREDRIWQATPRLPAGRVSRTFDLVPADPQRRGQLYTRIAVPEGLGHFIHVVLESGPDVFTGIGFLRGGDGGGFTDAEVALLEALTPHLQAAAALAKRVMLGDAARREALQSFDVAGQAIAVLDRSGYALHVNAAATRILGQGAGVTLRQGRFLFDSLAAQTDFERALHRIVAATADTEARLVPSQLRVSRQDAGRQLVLSMVPLARAADHAVFPIGAGCLVLLFDVGAEQELPQSHLQRIYGLTPAEMRVCLAIHRSTSVEEAAASLCLSTHTVRSHLKRIFSKFGVQNQSQLLHRLADSLHMVTPGDGARHTS